MKNILLAYFLCATGVRGEVVIPAPTTEPDRTHPIEAGPQREINFPVLRRLKAKNGMGVTADEIRTLPIVALSILIPAAANVRATLMFPEAEGLASMTASLLDENTQRRDGNAFSRAMESLGANYSISAGADALSASVFAKKERITAAVALVAEAVMHPAFRKMDLDRLKSQYLANLKESAASPESAAGRRLGDRIYGDHPFGAYMTPRSLANIKDTTLLKRYHSLAYRPEGASIHAAGDISIEETKQLADRYFSNWPSIKIPTSALKEMAKVPTPDVKAVAIDPGVIELIDHPGSPQSIIKIGQTALNLNHPDFDALSVLNSILGGPQGRIYEILREQKKWAYGAHSSMGGSHYGASLRINAPVQTDKTAESLIILLEELKRFQEEDITAAELEKVKVNEVQGTIGSVETVQSIANIRAGAELYGRGDDVFRQSRDAILAVTVADVRRAAKLYLRPESVAIVIVGDASKIKASLERIAPVRLIDAEGRPLVETALSARP